MRIGAASNAIFNSMTSGVKGNNHLGETLSPLEKQKLQLQEQMKKIEESESSKESKESSIKELQEKLEEIDGQLAKEKLVKPNEKLKDKDAKDEEIGNQNAEEEGKENSQVINKDVMIGITSASSHQKIGKVAYSVYREATARGDMPTAERALNYTKSEIKKSAEGRKLIERGIKKYKNQMERIKRTITEKVATDKNIKENGVVNENQNIITDEVHNSSTSKVATSDHTEAKPSAEPTAKGHSEANITSLDAKA